MSPTYTATFGGSLSYQPISLSIDTSSLIIPASTISIIETQPGVADISLTPATNTLTFGSNLVAGDFSLTHPNINSGTAVDVSINNVSPVLGTVTPGVTAVAAVNQTYALTVGGQPTSGYLFLHFGPYAFLIYPDMTADLNGQTYPSIQTAFTTLINNGSYGPDYPWYNSWLGYWKLDETSGTTAADSSGNGLTGTINGTLSSSTNIPSAIQFTDPGCFVFDGSSTYVDCGNDPSLQGNIGTFSCWFNTSDAGTGFRGIVTKQYDVGIFLNNNEFGYYDWGGTGWHGTGQYPNDGNWHHALITFQNGVTNGTNLYLDGNLVVTGSATFTNENCPFQIGNGGPDAIGQLFAGLIDDVRFYGTLLTSQEIANLAAGSYGDLVFVGPPTANGSPQWNINHNGWDVSVTDSWSDGSPAVIGAAAVQSLALPGAFGGTWALNAFTGIAWNIDPGTLFTFWTNGAFTSLSSVTGSGTNDDPWIVTYSALAPQSLPTITSTGLIGFSEDYLQSQIGTGFFTVTNPSAGNYVLTSNTNGEGQTEITAANVNLTASLSLDYEDQPITITPGVLGVVAAYPTWVLVLSGVPSGNYLIVQCNGGSQISIWGDGSGHETPPVQDQINSGAAGWTITSSGGFGSSQSYYQGDGGPPTITFTYNTQTSLGSNPWNIIDNYWPDVGVTIASATFTDGNAGVAESTCVQALPYTTNNLGAIGGGFDLVGSAQTISDIPYNIALNDLANDWVTATGYSLQYATNYGDTGGKFIFEPNSGPIPLPTINSNTDDPLIQNGSVSNDFNDGTTEAGQDEVQTISLADVPTEGTWTATLNSTTTSSLAATISASDLQSALQSAWSDSNIIVTGTTPYSVDFGVHAASPGTITADGTDLTKNPSVNITEIQRGQI